MHISFADTKLYELLVNKNGYIREEYDNYIKINFQKNKFFRLSSVHAEIYLRACKKTLTIL